MQLWPLGQFLVELHIIRLGLNGKYFWLSTFFVAIVRAKCFNSIWNLTFAFNLQKQLHSFWRAPSWVTWSSGEICGNVDLSWSGDSLMALVPFGNRQAMDKGTSWEMGRCSLRTDGLLQEAGSMFYKAPARGSFAEGFVEREIEKWLKCCHSRVSHIFTLLWFWNK